MPDLHALLASSIVCALEEREHVIVAPGCADALCAALEPVVAKGIPSLLSPPRGPRDEPSFPAVGDARRATLQRALDDTARRVAALLLATDHVDDIFADEAAIRRDVLRAMRRLLRDVQRGEIDVDGPPESSTPGARASGAYGDGAPSSSNSWRPPAPELGAGRGSWRPIARRSDPSGLLGDDAVSPSADGPLGYFLDNLERSLSVLEEYGEGPPSAPATLGAHTEPPPDEEPAAATARSSSRRKKGGAEPDGKRSGGAAATPLRARQGRRARTGTESGREPSAPGGKQGKTNPGPPSGGRRRARPAAVNAGRSGHLSPDGSKRTPTGCGTPSPRRRVAAAGTRAKR